LKEVEARCSLGPCSTYYVIYAFLITDCIELGDEPAQLRRIADATKA
jgi:hypothetical protein